MLFMINLTQTMKKSKTILTALGLLVLIVWDIMLCLNAYIDGKYMIEPYWNNELDETYYMRIDSLSIAMFVNLGIIIVLLCGRYIRRRKNRQN